LLRHENNLTLAHHPADTELTEGKARIQFPSHSGKVFYNPKMSLNRDLAILFINSHFPRSRQLQLCDPMTGSGVRAARYALESPNVARILAADKEPDAVELAQQTMRLNQVENKVTVTESEAYTLLANHPGERFDLIDLDPFGSPTSFFESALRATTEGGVLAATATDMGPLSGARPAACKRKYGVSPLRTEFGKELAIRTLTSSLASAAGRLGLGISVAFAHATDHYARIYAVVVKGRKLSNESLHNLGFMAYCPNCLARTTTPSLSSVRMECGNCGCDNQIGGPFWLGQLWDGRTVNAMVQHTPLLSSERLSEIQKVLTRIQDELDGPPFYYTTDTLAAAYVTKPPTIDSLLRSLRKNGYKASRTHFDSSGFRTNAPVPHIASLFRTISNETQS
jgi:tRNA (guanine26-N2/guanine27-N2)-dimethyltransferase